MCHNLSVSDIARSSGSAKTHSACQLLPLVREGHAAGRGNYGRPRLLAWQMALTQQRPPPGRGQHKPPGNGDDNAARESFWSALKRERIYRRHFATQAEARAASFDWINVLYNRTRRRSALGFQSPVDFETKLN